LKEVASPACPLAILFWKQELIWHMTDGLIGVADFGLLDVLVCLREGRSEDRSARCFAVRAVIDRNLGISFSSFCTELVCD
jgi:hypothetical protein